MRSNKSSLILACLVFGSAAFLLNPRDLAAQDVQDSARTNNDQAPTGFWIYGGLDLGYSWLTTSTATEGSKSGMHFGLRGLGSLYLESPWVLDLGVGWFYNNLSGTDPNGSEVKVTTRAAFIEAAARYRLDPLAKWQVGLVLDASFGTDITFAPTVGTGSAEIFLGLQGVYEVPLESSLRLRLNLSLLTDVSVSDRQFWVTMLGIQIGLPITAQPGDFRTLGGDEAPAHVITLDETIVLFETGSAKLSAKSKQLLVQVGAFLNSNNGLFDRVRIEGHTDKRGEYNFNLKLSQARGRSVLEAIREGGVVGTKLESEGYGPSMPIDKSDSDSAYAKNRRVELKFYGVTDPTPINDKIRELSTR